VRPLDHPAYLAEKRAEEVRLKAYSRVNPDQATNPERLPQPKGFVEIYPPIDFPSPVQISQTGKEKVRETSSSLRLERQ
jgi:hypothetical protein